MSDFDFVIIGAGPAGLAAGLTLLQRKGTHVAVLDNQSRTFLRPGESLSPGTRPLLEYLGVWQDFARDGALPTYSSQASWGSNQLSSLDYLFTVHGNGWALNRHHFDRLLSQRYTQQGGELFDDHHVDQITETAEGCQLNIQHNHQTQNIQCRYLIDASGRSGRIAKRLGGIKRRHDRLVGFSCIGENTAGNEANIVVEAGPYGWWYSTPLPHNRRATVFMTDSDISSDLGIKSFAVWHAQLQGARHIRQKAKFNHDSIVTAHAAYSSELVGMEPNKNWIAVGDAVSSFDPLSSSGIPHALASGIQGAHVAANTVYDNGQMFNHYQQSITDDYHEYLNTRWLYYNREQRWSHNPFWARRQLKVSLVPQAEITVDTIENCQIKASFLNQLQQQELDQICKPGLKAYQVAERFRRIHPEIPDEHIITALQLMLSPHEYSAA